MNSRERVLRALGRIKGLPDRVPVQFDLCRQLSEHFGKELGIPAHFTDNFYEDVTYRISANEIKVAMGNDIVATGASVSDNFKIKMNPDGTWLNEYNMTMRQGDVYVDVIKFPLAHVETKADLDKYNFPDPDAPGRYRDAENLVKMYHDNYLVFADVEVTIFSLAQQLVGMEKLLTDMMLEAEYVKPLFERCTEFQTQVSLNLIKAGVDAIWAGDDFGTQDNLLMPPEILRSQLKPLYKQMTDRMKAAKPDVINILHSCGAVKTILKDFYEMGYEVYNPVQPNLPGHDPKTIKDEVGDKLVLWGGIDQQYLLPRGTDEELEKEIKERMWIFGKGGGYIIAPAHIIQNDVSPARVKLFLELCMKYGRY
jgi:uroporphyrinogen decarboxylase